MEEFVGPKDHAHIVKGKRTKRQRPQSPIPFTIATNSSSGGGGYGSNGDNTKNIDHHNSNLSPDTSAEFIDSTEEEEDMANCLILLAQGHSRDKSQKRNNDHEDMETVTFKFNSKRYIETPLKGSGKVGMYVYECKTCSRTFSSFQALGGHRASHKKPKAAAAMTNDYHYKKPLEVSDDEELQCKNLRLSSSFTDLQLISNRALYSNNNGKMIKVHECSICGAEFSSGQALGGHMRRHRGPAGASTTLSLSPIALGEIEEDKKTKNIGLSLDLNLPAPEDHDQNGESKFSLASKQQQQQHRQQPPPLVLSAAPTLVDCHY